MTLQEYKKQKMQNPDFSAAYDEIQPEMDITGNYRCQNQSEHDAKRTFRKNRNQPD